MKKMKFLLVLLMFPAVAFAAGRGDGAARVGMSSRGSQAGARMSITSLDVKEAASKAPISTKVEEPEEVEEIVEVVEKPAKKTTKVVVKEVEESEEIEETKSSKGSDDCRESYRDCMDQFCLLDESQGERCACSDNIELAKSKIKAVLDIQAEADKLFTEGVEREQLGAKARLVFTENSGNKGVSGTNFLAWLGGESDDEDDDVGEDVTMGDDLYQMAVKYCSAELESCGSKGEMEAMLYTRMITQDCKNYDAYLKDQKANAESNKRIAESAVRKARLEMLDTTNKYNRGECLLAYRACIADKGGCGTNFENCLDKKLLERRSNACENILDQCMAVRDYVKQDWAQESKSVLEEAAKYADKNRRGTCLAQAQFCLEESCSTSTNAECLTNVNVAAGICPIITECEEIIPGFQGVINDKLGFLRTKFCENDIDKCLRDKCGQDFTKPECVGKKPYEIAALCPQDMFPSCNGAAQYDIIVQSAILQMDYQMLQGCVNYFGEQLSKVCGTDMACLPIDATIEALTDLPDTEEGLAKLRKQVVANSDAAVEEFFAQFERDKTVSACADSQSVETKKVKGKNSLGVSVFNSAKLLAKMSAENRNIRELDSKIAELARKKDLAEAKEICLKTYKPEKPDNSKSNYSYIHTVSFEPNLRNCHVCRMQQVCEEGGESKATSALKAAAGGLSAGASAGTMISAGWGTAIGGVVGAVGAGVMGAMSGGKKEFCQEIESCEDINM
ncbi:MAG: hypothetical protein IKZ49_02730 [Alphaproteobacteria bacterium]|nr:hypothetical protein [Alphaproteobacteria bacterium]